MMTVYVVWYLDSDYDAVIYQAFTTASEAEKVKQRLLTEIPSPCVWVRELHIPVNDAE